jgi:predicted GNAT family N-acyltransferase
LPPEAPLPGDELDFAVHIAAWSTQIPEDGASRALASTCFIYPECCPAFDTAKHHWHLRQMATDPRLRASGAGAAVILGVITYLVATDADLLWCHARSSAAGFYRKVGFASVGEEFTDERHPIPHLRMWRPLS